GIVIDEKALKSASEQVNRKFLPLLLDHNPKKILGVNLYSQVYKLDPDRYALIVLSGIYETDCEKNKYKIGDKNITSEDNKYMYRKMIRKSIATFRNELSKIPSMKYKPPKTLEGEIEEYLNRTMVDDNGRVYEIRAYIDSTHDLRIEIFPRDHLENPPHFHIISKQRGINARFNVYTLEHIDTKKGKVSSNDVKKIKKFFEMHQDVYEKLLKKYNLFREANEISS
ncbi:DUF4160 domain-containing protein, partial [Candidatus Dojkabacteria bacterium]|nr:DUF4160 domain-containing protein [Candidatus Dojkabacteria bacterium]